MKKGMTISIIIAVIIVIAVGVLLLMNNKTGSQKETTNPNQMVDCGAMKDPSCFFNRMNGCLPVTAKLIGTNDKSTIDITILGVENDTCHFQRKINNVTDLVCYFPKGTLNSDAIAQTFGEDKGLKSVVDAACKSIGW